MYVSGIVTFDRGCQLKLRLLKIYFQFFSHYFIDFQQSFTNFSPKLPGQILPKCKKFCKFCYSQKNTLDDVCMKDYKRYKTLALHRIPIP